MSREAKTTKTGELSLDLPTRLDAGVPYLYTLEADVEDVSRQHIANRASRDRASRRLVHRRPRGRTTSSIRRQGSRPKSSASRRPAR